MTKIIAALILIACLMGVYELFLYYDRIKNEEAVAKKEAAAAMVVGEQLPGVPQRLEPSLQAAQKEGASALKAWLKTYDSMVQDPRRAWIELDYCVLVARSDPAEARRVYAAVKERTPPSSPVWQRLKQLEKTYE
jgi:hypothetical protein